MDNGTARKGGGGERREDIIDQQRILNAQSMERCGEWARGVKEKKKSKRRTTRENEVSGEEERKAGDVEEWRPLKASIGQSVITEEEGRQTASLFFCRREKTCINFQVEGSLAPAASSSLCWAAARSSLLCFIHHKKKEDISPGASWVILRGRKRGGSGGERSAHGPFCYLLLT